ncbi:Cell death protease [Podila clonocystis]|nr:Cell death protease [Podila clonocystis]
MPGLSAEDAEQLLQYAGHIPLDPEMESQLFFWLVTNRTIPKKSKLASGSQAIIWLNGGPGCSSADGYFLEAGPVRFVNGALTLNKVGWHEFANVLFLDQPVGTGFSITSKQPLNTLGEVTDHFISFMKAFYAVFPERALDDLYIAGESYAGTYIPYFTKAILERNDILQPGEQAINLQGAIIGNGWTDPLHQYTSYIPFVQKYDISTPAMLETMENQMNHCMDAIRLQDKITQDACEKLVEIIMEGTKTGGQQDLICNHIGTEYMISNLTWDGARGFQQVPTVGWTVEDQPAGEWQTQRNLSYVLIYNSSHMVPYDVPLVTLDMINRFIGIDHKLQSFASRLETDLEEELPPKGEKQDIDQGKPSFSSVNGAAVLILTMIAVCVALFVIVRNNRRQRKHGGDAQWYPLNRQGNIHTDELDELVLESGIRESMDDDEDDDDEGSDRRDERHSLDDSEDEDYQQRNNL